ncbi:MAG: DsbA family protein, partial [bacterium]|nr:DsbA family protein [bacterium]
MKRTLFSLVLAAGLGLAGAAQADGLDFGSMNEAERAAFHAEVRAYLLKNPEVIFEAIQILEERRNMAEAEADRDMVRDNAGAIFTDGFSFSGGNPDGDVTVVEFLDYRCGYCKRAHPEV